MPRIKGKPQRFRPLSPVETPVAQIGSSNNPVVNTITSTPEQSISPSTDVQHNSHPRVVPIAVPLANLITTNSCLPISTVALLAQEGGTTNNGSHVTAPLVSTAIIPALTPLRLTFPTVPTLTIDFGSMLWPGGASATLSLLNKSGSSIAAHESLTSRSSPKPTAEPHQQYQSSELTSTPSLEPSASKPLTSKSTLSVINQIQPHADKETHRFFEVKRPHKKDRELTNCVVCHKLMRRGSIREHMDRHNNSGRFECPECGKTFSRASAREKHLRIHTGEKPYQCSHCSKAYRQRVHLNEHMRSHTGNRPYVCLFCGFALASKSLLNRHVRTHWNMAAEGNSPEPKDYSIDNSTEDTGFNKAISANIITDDNTGKIHMKNSSSTMSLPESSIERERLRELWRKHTCDECSTGFPTLQALRSHRMTTHGFVPSHPCPQCGETFSSNKLRKQHLRLTHPQFCPVCSKQMAQRRRWFLEAHIRDEHPEVSAVDVIGPSPLTNFWRKRFEIDSIELASDATESGADPNQIDCNPEKPTMIDSSVHNG
ncbi:Zinc finger protein [Fasciola hepatica]|uniref:Zinc finger protein n=1 Tax=Fasciola hepatica TaxID=6192 RepID=A0A4E0RDU9_FASHE|nr:Zinc finger protein [Fasciola hepatica]